jgi:hypothetical protein
MTETIYEIRYNRLIDKARKRALTRKQARDQLPGEMIHEHHIIPSCLGGPNSLSNYAYLTTEEHIKAHELLAIIHPDHEGLAGAADLLREDFGYVIKPKKKKKEDLDWTYAETLLAFQRLIARIKEGSLWNISELEKIERQYRNFIAPPPKTIKNQKTKPIEQIKRTNLSIFEEQLSLLTTGAKNISPHYLQRFISRDVDYQKQILRDNNVRLRRLGLNPITLPD